MKAAEVEKLDAIFASASRKPEARTAIVPIVVSTTSIAPLSEAEIKEFTECEAKIKMGFETFVEMGSALARIREGRLYRPHYPDFDAYVESRWEFTKQRASQLIQASDAWNAFSGRIDKNKLPATERAMRELLKAPADKVAEILDAVAIVGEPTTERIITACEKVIPKKAAKPKAKRKAAIKIEAALKAAELLAEFLSVKKLSTKDRATLKVVSELPKRTEALHGLLDTHVGLSS